MFGAGEQGNSLVGAVRFLFPDPYMLPSEPLWVSFTSTYRIEVEKPYESQEYTVYENHQWVLGSLTAAACDVQCSRESSV